MGWRALRTAALPALPLAVAAASCWALLAASWWAVAANTTWSPVSNPLTGTLAVRAGRPGRPGEAFEPCRPPFVVTLVALPGVETRGAFCDGLLEVVVPAGAVTSPTSFTIALVCRPPRLPPGAVRLSRAYRVAAAGEVQRPIGLVFRVSQRNLGGAWIQYWDEALRAWLAVPTSLDAAAGWLAAPDPAARQLTATDGLSLFQVVWNPGIPVMTDIRGHWAEADILRLASLGMIEAPGGFFGPDEPLTRAGFARLLCLGLRLPAGTGRAAWAGQAAGARPATWTGTGPTTWTGTGPATWADAPLFPGWAVPYLGAAWDRGLMIGYPDGSFRPLQLIRRDEVATVLSRALGSPRGGPGPPSVPPSGFADWELVPSWAQPYVSVAASAGLLRGYPEPGGGFTFRSAGLMTRAEGVAVLWRLMEEMER